MASGLLNKMQKSKKPFVMIAVILIFGAVFYYVFFLAASFEVDSDIKAPADPIVEDSYEEYRNYISNTSKGIKNLLDGEQLKGLRLYEYVHESASIERNSNPFTKSY